MGKRGGKRMPQQDKNPQGGNITSLTDAKALKLLSFNKQKYGDVIRKFRQNRDLTQPQLAKLLGVQKNYISNWESGRARPDINIIPKLCAALDITISAFFGSPGRDEELSGSEQRLLHNYRFLSIQDRQVVEKLIDALLDAADMELQQRCRRGFEYILHTDLRCSAGTGNPLDGGDGGEYVYVRSDHDTCRADLIVTVTGDSMEPTFRNGDDLLVEYAEELAPGEIGLFVADGDGFVKEYQSDGLHSHNPNYDVLKFSDDDGARCVGRVLGKIDPEQYATPVEKEILEEMRLEREKSGSKE
jgi:transcriptional regulator with XRE-family HTH domain